MPARPSRLRTALGLPACAVIGVVVGVLATFKSRTGVADGVPYGLVLGLLLVLLVALALRLGLRGRRFGVAAAVGLLAAAAVLTLPSAGGSVVEPPDAIRNAWLIGVALAGAAGAALPLPRSAHRADGILADDEGGPS